MTLLRCKLLRALVYLPVAAVAFPAALRPAALHLYDRPLCESFTRPVAFHLHRRARCSRVQARSQDNYDPEDPWDQALEAFEAQRRQAEEDAESMRAGADGASGWTGLSNQVLLDSERKREDESPDWEFYDSPRLVYHADNDVFTRLTALYRELLPATGGTILDLGASWVSHLPDDCKFARVEGLGMNAAELKSNPRLDSWRVHDLNWSPEMHLPSNKYDAVLICFAIQYFKYPEKILAQAATALKDDGVLIISWGSGCFQSKAIRGWLNRDAEGRTGLVLRLLALAGFVGPQVHESVRANPAWKGADELLAVSARRGGRLADGQVARVRDERQNSQGWSSGKASERDVGGEGGVGGGEEGEEAMMEGGAGIYSPELSNPGLTLPGDSALVWEDRLQDLMEEAQSLGIPRTAFTKILADLPDTPGAESIRAAMKEIHLIIASRLSSDL